MRHRLIGEDPGLADGNLECLSQLDQHRIIVAANNITPSNLSDCATQVGGDFSYLKYGIVGSCPGVHLVVVQLGEQFRGVDRMTVGNVGKGLMVRTYRVQLR